MQPNVWKALHEHYMKDVSTRVLMKESSSHSLKMEINVLANEIDRIIRNCSPHLDWKEGVTPHVNYFMKRMSYSGYSKDLKFKVLQKALLRYRKRAQRFGEGKSFYTMTDEEEEVRDEGNSKKDDEEVWYREGGKYESVMFIEATPESTLKNRIENVIKKHGMKIKVVERVGETMKSLLQRSDPFSKKLCDKTDCVICGKDLKINCRERGCVYQLRCLECTFRVYRGQTSRAIYSRTKEHENDLRKKKKGAPLTRHSELYHGGNPFEYDVKIIAKCFGKPTRRLITEAVHIDELKDDQCMNGKKEWTYYSLKKV